MERLVDLVRDGGVAVLTGAGVSTDSGIPDYRGDPNRVRRPPITYREFVTDVQGRRRYWARSHLGWRRITDAVPNTSHQAVANLEAAGLVGPVITQNVDGLHTAAGSRRVLELHGSLHRTLCLGCGDRRSRLELHHRLSAANPRFDEEEVEFAPDGDAVISDGLTTRFRVVDCLGCGGLLKPDVIFFGENIPRPRVEEAYRLVAAATSLLVLGSSLTVMSGYRFVLAAHAASIPVAIVNRGPTRGDQLADVRIEGGLAPVMAALARTVGGPAGRYPLTG
ncbi:MAG TPA: NAD-dependent protein deacetylase [Acidimicrobiia bacterium]|nr:NAD-dependent protein deacetylase [Acidimicrobiia bacterium]